MLKRLYIKNYALIDELDVNFHQGFSVITGETGAGKSIILGAVALLLGQRADSKSIKPGTDKCIIEACFDFSQYKNNDFFTENDIDFDAEECIIRRELMISGKSRAFINDSPVQLSLLKELGEQLMDVHSQHQNLLLNTHDFQLNVVDIIAEDDKELHQYQRTFQEYQKTEKELIRLEEETSRNQQNQEFYQFQYNELSQAKLIDGEQEELEQKSDTMSHSEDIKRALYEASTHMSSEQTGIVNQLRMSLLSLKQIGKIFPPAEELAERIDSCYIEMKDISEEVESLLESVDFDPSEFDQINNRLDRLYDLEKKYHVESITQLIDKRNELERFLDSIDNSDESLSILRRKVENLCIQAQNEAESLSKKRIKAAKKIEEELKNKLVPLGMPNVKFSIQINKEPLNSTGQDKVLFLFSANTSIPLQPITQVASGGEIARVMLSLKAMIGGAVKLPTIIFDEIDTGVSGKIAEKMAEMMRGMGLHGRQVISITHLPQIAALGSTHYKVEKIETSSGTISKMKEISDTERIMEIAQMLSGSDVTDAAIENAKQLLKISN